MDEKQPEELKLYCIFSRESLERMGGNRGKMAAQAGHAYLHSWWDACDRFPRASSAYARSGAAAKICLVCDTDEELLQLFKAHQSFCGVTYVVDAGRTVFKGEPTLTCIGIGPITPSQRSELLKSLRPLL